MSLLDLRQMAPCSVCRVEMVPLGKMGDTGNKKCQKCIGLLQRQRKKTNKRYYKLRVAICVRCGKEYTGRKEICALCQDIIVDWYNNTLNRDCIYCDKPSGQKSYCSRLCISKTSILVKRRRAKLNEVLKD